MRHPVRTVTRAGRTYRVHDHVPAGGWDFWGVFESGAWEPHLEGILTAHLPAGGLLLDVGAWVGPVTLIAAAMGATVHAVEPDPVAAPYLRGNTALSGHGRVTVHECALAAHDGTVRIGRRADRELGDSMTSTIFGLDAIDVPARTFAALTDGVGRVDLVKMDIEGGEETVLPACVPALRAAGVPLLLDTHAMLVADPRRYRDTLDACLTGWRTTVVVGNPDVLATVLAVPA